MKAVSLYNMGSVVMGKVNSWGGWLQRMALSKLSTWEGFIGSGMGTLDGRTCDDGGCSLSGMEKYKSSGSYTTRNVVL